MTDNVNPWLGSKDKPGYLAYIITAVIIIGGLLMIRSCANQPRVPSTRPRTGDIAIITQQTFCGFSQQSIDEISRRSVAKDAVGIQQLIRSGQAGTLTAGQKVKVISTGILTMTVRPIEPPNQDRECFVPAEVVRLETPR